MPAATSVATNAIASGPRRVEDHLPTLLPTARLSVTSMSSSLFGEDRFARSGGGRSAPGSPSAFPDVCHILDEVTHKFAVAFRVPLGVEDFRPSLMPFSF